MRRYFGRLAGGETFLKDGISVSAYEYTLAGELDALVTILEIVQDCIDAGGNLHEAIGRLIAWKEGGVTDENES
jgi:hypothetical protein